jgi:hypothetical protein
MNNDVEALLVRDWTKCPQRVPNDSLFFLGFVTEALLEGCPMLGPMLEQHLAEIRFTRPLSKGASAYGEEREIELEWLHPCSQDFRFMDFWDRVKRLSNAAAYSTSWASSVPPVSSTSAIASTQRRAARGIRRRYALTSA